MSRKILPIQFPPVNNCYSSSAGLTAVLQTHASGQEMMLMNSIFLYVKSNNVLKYAVVERAKLGEQLEIISQQALETKLIEQMSAWICEEKYIFMFLDHYFLRDSSRFQRQHFLHDVALVYGYDEERGVFAAADNFTNGKYGCLELSYSEVEQARCLSGEKMLQEKVFNILLFNMSKMREYYIDTRRIKQLLMDYLDSSCKHVLQMNDSFIDDNVFGFHFQHQNYDVSRTVYGIGIYDWLVGYLNQGASAGIKLDIRPFHQLSNHKAVLIMLMKHLAAKYGLHCEPAWLDILEQMRIKCLVNEQLVLKYQIERKEEYIRLIRHNLDGIRKSEAQVIQECIGKL
ncbi:hypothetical protein [Paenibacillus massiliensis]|uniref:hypothetical protein n=1 Tax=Paenibacillus massiliensis TaxID=225917 RepID=UPI0012EC7006|nr:hypothetical protein [Paenibacillus massiliensis]